MNDGPDRNGHLSEKIRNFRHWMADSIKGQDHALDALASHFARSELGLTERGLPKGGWLFVGPTGVGKTEITKLAARYWAGLMPDLAERKEEEYLARFDMSEYMEKRSVAEFIRRVCLAVRSGVRWYLFDEIDKAEMEIFNLFLQILSAARLTDADGATVDMSDCYLVLTSNAGAETAMRSRTGNRVAFEATIKTKVQQQLKKPELIGRFEEVGSIVVFYPLDAETQWQVAQVAVSKIQKRMAQLGHTITLDADAMNFVMRNGFKPELGARPLQGLLRREIEGAVARAVLDVGIARGELTVNQARSGLELKPSESAAE
jgi:ATP-dependent Clp protease ATP-binding subunit ClpC